MLAARVRRGIGERQTTEVCGHCSGEKRDKGDASARWVVGWRRNHGMRVSMAVGARVWNVSGTRTRITGRGHGALVNAHTIPL